MTAVAAGSTVSQMNHVTAARQTNNAAQSPAFTRS
jgi:hypothetical protein